MRLCLLAVFADGRVFPAGQGQLSQVPLNALRMCSASDLMPQRAAPLIGHRAHGGRADERRRGALGATRRRGSLGTHLFPYIGIMRWKTRRQHASLIYDASFKLFLGRCGLSMPFEDWSKAGLTALFLGAKQTAAEQTIQKRLWRHHRYGSWFGACRESW